MTVVTVGEVLMRLSHTALRRADGFVAHFGGAEANVAIALAGMGVQARHVTALPDHDLGQAAFDALRRYGVDPSFILRGAGRLGLYFYERGASLRPGKVIYDRAGSLFSLLPPSAYDLRGALAGADYLHMTGVTPALGENARRLTLDAVRLAKEMGVKVSFDLNFRSSLWTEEDAFAFFEAILPSVDLLTASSDGLAVLGQENAGTDLKKAELAARAIAKKWGIPAVALTLRESVSANFNRLSALYLSDMVYTSRVYPVEIVDRVGGGDAFSAGLLYALSNREENPAEFAAAANAYKHTVEGDFLCVSSGEIRALMAGDVRIRR